MATDNSSEKQNILKIELSQDDVRNLDIFFLHARKAVVENEAELLNLMTCKKSLFDKLTGKANGESNHFNEEDFRNLEVVFLYARKANIEHEKELLNIIQFKKSLAEKFSAGIK